MGQAAAAAPQSGSRRRARSGEARDSAVEPQQQEWRELGAPSNYSYNYSGPFDTDVARRRNYTTSASPQLSAGDKNDALFSFRIDDEASSFSQQELIRKKVKSRKNRDRIKPPTGRIPLSIPRKHKKNHSGRIPPVPKTQSSRQGHSSLGPFLNQNHSYRLQDDDETSLTIFRSLLHQEFSSEVAEDDRQLVTKKHDEMESSSTAETTKSSLEHHRDTKQLIKDSYQLISQLEEKRQFEQQSTLKQRHETGTSKHGVRFDARLFDEESSVPFDQRHDESLEKEKQLEEQQTKQSPDSVSQIADLRQQPHSLPRQISQPRKPKSILKASRFQTSPSPTDTLTHPTPNYGHLHYERAGAYSEWRSPSQIGVPKPTKRSPMEPLRLFDTDAPRKVSFTESSTAAVDNMPVRESLPVKAEQQQRDAVHGSIGHPAEKHLLSNLAISRNSSSDRVLESQFPDPPSVINVQEDDVDEETVSSAYLFIETVAAIVIQTSVRRFLASLAVQRRLRHHRVQGSGETVDSEISPITYESSYATATRDAPATETMAQKRHHFDSAAAKIQAAFRGYWVRDCLDVDHYCARAIQATYRGCIQRQEYLNDLRRIVLVQSWWRRNIAREAVAHLLACAIIIQAAARGRIFRRKYKRFLRKKAKLHNQAATLIQAAIRGFQIRWRYKSFLQMQSLHRAAVLIQAVVRGFRIRWRYERYLEKKYRIMHAAATRIQATWRCVVSESYYVSLLVDVLITQTVARRWLALRRVNGLRQKKLRLRRHSLPHRDNAIAHSLHRQKTAANIQRGQVSQDRSSAAQSLSPNQWRYQKKEQVHSLSPRSFGDSRRRQTSRIVEEVEPSPQMTATFGKKGAVIAYPELVEDEAILGQTEPTTRLPRPAIKQKIQSTGSFRSTNESSEMSPSSISNRYEVAGQPKPYSVEEFPQQSASPNKKNNSLLAKWQQFERENALKSG